MWDFSMTAVTFSSPQYSFDGKGPPTDTFITYVGTTWPNLWSWDSTTFTFDSNDTTWSMDGGDVRGGEQKGAKSSRLSITNTANLRF